MAEPTEGKIQSTIVSWYNNSYCLSHHSPRCLIFSIPNGGERNVAASMMSRAMGEYKGASDLVVIHFGKVMFVRFPFIIVPLVIKRSSVLLYRPAFSIISLHNSILISSYLIADNKPGQPTVALQVVKPTSTAYRMAA